MSRNFRRENLISSWRHGCYCVVIKPMPLISDSAFNFQLFLCCLNSSLPKTSSSGFSLKRFAFEFAYICQPFCDPRYCIFQRRPLGRISSSKTVYIEPLKLRLPFNFGSLFQAIPAFQFHHIQTITKSGKAWICQRTLANSKNSQA